MKRKARRRPAETGAIGVAATIVAILALFNIHVDEGSVALIVAAVGVVPAIITAIVDRVRQS